MTYVRNAWYVAAWSPDLPKDAPAAVQIMGEPIVVWWAGERLVAHQDRCVHRLAPLSLGRCEGASLRCMYHGLRYDADGRCVEIPGQETIPPQVAIKSYPAIDRHSWAWIWMGDPALADPELIPPAVGFDDPDYILGRGFLDYEAEASLVCDNLLDFSHLSFVHAQSFGASMVFADAQPMLAALPRGIRVSRWLNGDNARLRRPSEAETETWQSYDFLLPGILLMKGGVFATGTAAASGHGEPDYNRALAGVTFTSQAVTPVGDGKARYFFSWGPHRDHGDEAMRDQLMQIAEMAFAEDKAIIEGQQRVIDRTQAPVVMPTAHDRGVTMFNRLVARMANAVG